MSARGVVILVAAVDCVIFAAAVFATFMSGSDAATKGLDTAAGGAVTLLFVVTALPALVLIVMRRAPRAALALALAFPAVLTVLFLAAVIWLAS